MIVRIVDSEKICADPEIRFYRFSEQISIYTDERLSLKVCGGNGCLRSFRSWRQIRG